MDKKQRIILFWVLTMVGFISHSMMDVLPAFWGESIASMTSPAPVGMIIFMATLTYLVPVAGILLALYGKGRTPKVINAVLACFMAVFTLGHMSEMFMEFNPVQLFIMPMMFVVALLMAIDSIKVCKEQTP